MVLIMQGVSDLVSFETGEAEGNWAQFLENIAHIMPMLVGVSTATYWAISIVDAIPALSMLCPALIASPLRSKKTHSE